MCEDLKVVGKVFLNRIIFLMGIIGIIAATQSWAGANGSKRERGCCGFSFSKKKVPPSTIELTNPFVSENIDCAQVIGFGQYSNPEEEPVPLDSRENLHGFRRTREEIAALAADEEYLGILIADCFPDSFPDPLNEG